MLVRAIALVLLGTAAALLASAQSTAFTRPLQFRWPTNFINYNGVRFATLDNADPTNEDRQGCQNDVALALPPDWQLASMTPESFAAVLTHPWRTSCLLLDSGECVSTVDGDVLNTTQTNNVPLLVQNAPGYYSVYRATASSPCSFPARILITQPGADSDIDLAAPASPSHTFIYDNAEYATLDNAPVQALLVEGRQRVPLAVPDGWRIAENSARVRTALIGPRHRFGTTCLVFADGTSVFIITGSPCGNGQLLTTATTVGASRTISMVREGGARRIVITRENTTLPELDEFVPIERVVNFVSYQGKDYATMVDSPAHASSSPNVSPCQDVARRLPAGWEVAHDDEDARDVAMRFPFSTSCVLVASGRCFYRLVVPQQGFQLGVAESAADSLSNDTLFSDLVAVHSTLSYAPLSCNRMVLMQRPRGTLAYRGCRIDCAVSVSVREWGEEFSLHFDDFLQLGTTIKQTGARSRAEFLINQLGDTSERCGRLFGNVEPMASWMCTYKFREGEIVVRRGTDLANYTLPLRKSHVGLIDREHNSCLCNARDVQLPAYTALRASGDVAFPIATIDGPSRMFVHDVRYAGVGEQACEHYVLDCSRSLGHLQSYTWTLTAWPLQAGRLRRQVASFLETLAPTQPFVVLPVELFGLRQSEAVGDWVFGCSVADATGAVSTALHAVAVDIVTDPTPQPTPQPSPEPTVAGATTVQPTPQPTTSSGTVVVDTGDDDDDDDNNNNNNNNAEPTPSPPPTPDPTPPVQPQLPPAVHIVGAPAGARQCTADALLLRAVVRSSYACDPEQLDPSLQAPLSFRWDFVPQLSATAVSQLPLGFFFTRDLLVPPNTLTPDTEYTVSVVITSRSQLVSELSTSVRFRAVDDLYTVRVLGGNRTVAPPSISTPLVLSAYLLTPQGFNVPDTTGNLDTRLREFIELGALRLEWGCRCVNCRVRMSAANDVFIDATQNAANAQSALEDEAVRGDIEFFDAPCLFPPLFFAVGLPDEPTVYITHDLFYGQYEFSLTAYWFGVQRQPAETATITVTDIPELLSSVERRGDYRIAPQDSVFMRGECSRTPLSWFINSFSVAGSTSTLINSANLGLLPATLPERQASVTTLLCGGGTGTGLVDTDSDGIPESLSVSDDRGSVREVIEVGLPPQAHSETRVVAAADGGDVVRSPLPALVVTPVADPTGLDWPFADLHCGAHNSPERGALSYSFHALATVRTAERNTNATTERVDLLLRPFGGGFQRAVPLPLGDNVEIVCYVRDVLGFETSLSVAVDAAAFDALKTGRPQGDAALAGFVGNDGGSSGSDSSGTSNDGVVAKKRQTTGDDDDDDDEPSPAPTAAEQSSSLTSPPLSARELKVAYDAVLTPLRKAAQFESYWVLVFNMLKLERYVRVVDDAEFTRALLENVAVDSQLVTASSVDLIASIVGPTALFGDYVRNVIETAPFVAEITNAGKVAQRIALKIVAVNTQRTRLPRAQLEHASQSAVLLRASINMMVRAVNRLYRLLVSLQLPSELQLEPLVALEAAISQVRKADLGAIECGEPANEVYEIDALGEFPLKLLSTKAVSTDVANVVRIGDAATTREFISVPGVPQFATLPSTECLSVSTAFFATNPYSWANTNGLPVVAGLGSVRIFRENFDEVAIRLDNNSPLRFQLEVTTQLSGTESARLQCIRWQPLERAWTASGCQVPAVNTVGDRRFVGCSCVWFGDYSVWVANEQPTPSPTPEPTPPPPPPPAAFIETPAGIAVVCLVVLVAIGVFVVLFLALRRRSRTRSQMYTR